MKTEHARWLLLPLALCAAREAAAQTAFEFSAVSWVIYGVPLSAMVLAMPWVLERSRRAFAWLVLAGAIYGWLAAGLLDPTNVASPLAIFHFGVAMWAVIQFTTVLGFSLPVVYAALIVLIFNSRLHPLAGACALLVGAALAFVGRFISFFAILLLSAMLG